MRILVAVLVCMMLAVDLAAQSERRVPAMRESVYKRLAEAQVMIDPASIPNAPVGSQANPQGAIEILYGILGRRGINSYERAQTWNTLAFAYYTMGDMDQTIGAYEAVLRETITEALELSTLRALFQLNYANENYARSIDFIGRWEALSGKPDPDVTFIKATAYYQMEDYQSALRETQNIERIATSLGIPLKENWLYLQVVIFNELGDLASAERVLTKLNTMYPKEQYQQFLANLRSGATTEEAVKPEAHPVFDLVNGRLVLKTDGIQGFNSAGIVSGTQVHGIKFQKMTSWADLAALDLRPGTPITVEVQRGEGTTFLPVKLTAEDIALIKTPVSATVSSTVEVEVKAASGGFGVSDGEYLPIVKVQPVYPRRALSRGMQGWVVVEFTVTEQGTVKNPVVVENCAWIKPPDARGECFDSPNDIFDSAAMRAAEKFKYKPKVLDGQPIETHGVQNKLTFELFDE